MNSNKFQKIFYLAILFTMGFGLYPSKINAQGSKMGIRMVAPPIAKVAGLDDGSWWSKIDGTLDIAEAMKDMRARGRMGISEECDYDKVISTIKDGANSLRMLKDLEQNKPKGKWGLPTIDVVQMFLHLGETIAHTASVRAEKKGLIEHIEQVCQTGVQQDEIKRQLDLTKMAKEGTTKAISPVFGLLDLEKIRESSERDRITETWKIYFHEVTGKGTLPGDTALREADAKLLHTMYLSQQLHQRLDDLTYMLNIAYTQLYIPAYANGICPGSQQLPAPPGAEMLDLGGGVKRASCGPVSDEKASQVLAEIDLIKTQIKGIQTVALVQLQEVKTIELTRQIVEGKTNMVKNNSGLFHGF